MSVPYIYKQSNVKVSFESVVCTDIPEDEDIVVEYPEDHWTSQANIGGGGIYSARSSRKARITVPIMQGSKWISILNTYKLADKMITVTVSDNNSYDGASTFISAYSVIQDSGASYGTEASSRTFVFECMHILEVNNPTE